MSAGKRNPARWTLEGVSKTFLKNRNETDDKGQQLSSQITADVTRMLFSLCPAHLRGSSYEATGFSPAFYIHYHIRLLAQLLLLSDTLSSS